MPDSAFLEHVRRKYGSIYPGDEFGGAAGQTGQGLPTVIEFILDRGMLRGKDRLAAPAA